MVTMNPDSKVHGAHMGPNRVLSAPDGPHVGPMNLVIREDARRHITQWEVNMTAKAINTSPYYTML